MSENVDRIIDDQIKQRPGARHAYQHDPAMHGDIERTRSMLTVMEAAMQREGIPYDSAERVLNEIVSTGLDGWERDKLSRERLLLLADMTAVLEPTAEETAEVFGTRQETMEWLEGNMPSEVAGWARAVFDRAQAERPDEEQS